MVVVEEVDAVALARGADNLLDTLLGFAAAGRPTLEDPVTEILAWLLRRDEGLRDAFLVTFGLPVRSVDVETQVTLARTTGGTCRPDLILSNRRVSSRVLIEVKVNAGLTPSGTGDGSQVDDYLAIAEGRADDLVFTLAPRAIYLGAAASHPRFVRHVLWQEVYDAFRQKLRRDEADIDPVASVVAHQFLDVMEKRRMATPPLTFDGALSVRRFARFRDSFQTILDEVTRGFASELRGFGNRSRWKEGEHQRMGYSFSTEVGNGFCFMGLYHDEDTLVEGVPDLYVFLEVARGSAAQEALDGKAAALSQAVSALNDGSSGIVFGYEPGGWQSIWAVQSLADVISSEDSSGATRAFFETAMARMRSPLIEPFLEVAPVL